MPAVFPATFRGESSRRRFRYAAFLSRSITVLPLTLGALVALPRLACADSPIRLDTVGYLPDHDKRASIAAPCTDYSIVRDGGNETVMYGKTRGPVHNADTNEDLYIADFSALKRPGTYRLDIPGVGRSAPFRVGRDVYNSAFATALNGMYLWRCGTAVKSVYNGVTFAHDACHLEDAWLDFVDGKHERRDSTKGWHDAGDYNKYVVNAGVTVGTLLRAWEQFGPQINKMRSGLPETEKGMPAFLSEIKWEMDWLLTMQQPDGSVLHKVSTQNFGGAFPPEKETTPRFFVPWSSSGTADFVAMTAQFARLVRPYDSAYAARCLTAARRSYAFLAAHPEDHPAEQSKFQTGGYGTTDPDERLWAVAELWETTGEANYLRDFQTRARAFPNLIDANWGWGDVKNLGMLTYLFSRRTGRDMNLVRQVREAVLKTANDIVATRNAHGYARPLGTTYYWGCNGNVATTTVLLQSANRLAPNPAYVETALDAIHHLFGRNVYGRSFVTGLGADPPQHPHDRRSMYDPKLPAWPGYLVGGGWPKATDWKDESARYDLNEIAINWNAPLIYALASFVNPTSTPRAIPHVTARSLRFSSDTQARR